MKSEQMALHLSDPLTDDQRLKALIDLANTHTARLPCQGAEGEYTVDVGFYRLALVLLGIPFETLRKQAVVLLGTGFNTGVHDKIDLLDGVEHSYLEIGYLCGYQGHALAVMGFLTLISIVRLLTPKTIMGIENYSPTGKYMIGQGLVSIQAYSFTASHE